MANGDIQALLARIQVLEGFMANQRGYNNVKLYAPNPTTQFSSAMAAETRSPVVNLIAPNPPRTPATSADAGMDGDICWDDAYIYVHVNNHWRRAATATF